MTNEVHPDVDGEASALGEKEWAAGICQRLDRKLRINNTTGSKVRVCAGKKLPYTCEVHEYGIDGSETLNFRINDYETDILIYDEKKNGSWIPRVVIECKLGGKKRAITTHDVLTYSAKAATHKHVHPYLRYGVLAGQHKSIPARLVTHGAHFDFMAVWANAESNDSEWETFCGLIDEEIRTSRDIQNLQTNNRSASRKRYHILHRRLSLS